MSATPEWPKHPSADPARPADDLFGPASRYPPWPPPAELQSPQPAAPGIPTGPQVPPGPQAPPGPPGPPAGLNSLAVLAFVLSFVVSPAAIVLGYLARGQIRRSGESGDGLAIAAMVIGAVFTVAGVVAAAFAASVLLKSVPTAGAPFPGQTGPTPTIAAPAPSLSADDLAHALMTRLTGRGVKATNIDCPSDLQGVPGQTVRCTALVTDQQPVDLVVTVGSVAGGSINWDYRAEARPIARSLLEVKVAELMAQQTGARPHTTTCDGDLPAVVGQQVGCTLIARSGTMRVIVTTTGTDGGQITFRIAQR